MRRSDLLRRREHDGHLAASLDALHQPRPLGDQRQAVFEAHHAGDAGGRVFADAVPEHDVRRDAPRLPQLGQRILQREQRRLRELRFDGSSACGIVGRDVLRIEDVDERFAVPDAR